MEIVYVAHSASCALLLDAGGVCRWFVMKVDDDEVRASARRCVGAQFVASLDPDDPGLLGREPRIDRSVLFASVDGGRVSLIRFGPILEFERIDDAPCSTQTEAPQAEATKTEAPRAEAAQMEAPQTETPIAAERHSDTTLQRAAPPPAEALYDFDDLETQIADRRAHFAIRETHVYAADAAPDTDDVSGETRPFARHGIERDEDEGATNELFTISAAPPPRVRRGVLPRRHAN